MGQLHHPDRAGHIRRRVVTVATAIPVKTWILRVISTVPAVVALTFALVVTVILDLEICPGAKKFQIESHCQFVVVSELSN